MTSNSHRDVSFAHRRVGASGGCSGGRENVLAVLAVGNCCHVAVCSAAEGTGHTVAAARLQLVQLCIAPEA